MASSYNELFGLGSHSEDSALEGWWNLQDDAASTTVVDDSSNGRDGTMTVNTSTKSVATGPTSYLPNAMTFNGDYIDLGTGYLGSIATNGEYTVLAWIEYNSATRIVWGSTDTNGLGDANGLWELNSGRGGTNREFMPTHDSNDLISHSIASSTWASIGGAMDYDGNDSEMYVNGASVGTETTFVVSLTTTGIAHRMGSAPNTSRDHDGKLAGAALFSRRLTTAEVAQFDAGPEPVNSLAPAVTGTGEVGEVLTTTNGTWGLDSPFASGSNGTTTYTYRWTRSDDSGGTGEANISGATSSTYTVLEADAGKFLRCVVAATNDGGNDSSANTPSNMTEIVSGRFAGINKGLVNFGLINTGLVH